MDRKPIADIFIETALLFAERATCERRKVGAVITINKRIVATGYNGPLPNHPHCSPELCDTTKNCKRAIHAEANAIMFAAREGISLMGGHLYATVSPCRKCAELIILSGIDKVFFKHIYREGEDMIKFLNDYGIFTIDIV